jgi:predicted Fe-Mo cluster-binding NifX family protein
MKIAVVIDDEKTISQHFGRAQYYLVYTVEDGAIRGNERRDKPGHQHFAGEHHDHDHSHEHGTDAHSDHKHDQMIAPISDCEALIVRGMGRGAYLALEQARIRPFVTDIRSPDEAVQAYLDNTLTNHTEKLH